MNFLKKRWYLVLVIVLFLGFLFFKFTAKPKTTEKSYKVKTTNLKEELSFSGQIDALEKVTLRFQTSGRLAWVGVKEGDYVKKYQTLASLDQRDIKNRLQKYLNTFVSQRLTFDQTKDDYWNKQYDLSESIRKSAERTLQDSQYDLNNSVLDVELQSLTVEYANLWTPIEGIVTHVSAPNAGVNITPAGADFEIVNPKTLYFSATAEQGDVINLREGMIGEISFDAFPEKIYKSRLYYVSFSPKEGETGTVYEVRVELNEDALNLPLKLAMTGDLDFLIKEEKEVLSVPSSYIKKDKKGKYVYVGGATKKEK